MKKATQISIIILSISIFAVNLHAIVSIPAIGDASPAFKAVTTKGQVNFPADYKGKWIVLFSHPADFTPVCETEFKKLAQMVPEFEKLNAQLIGLSVDKAYIHDAWMKELEKDENKKINFPVIDDSNKTICNRYGLIHPKENKDQTIRAVYIIDPVGVVKGIFFYPISNGRSFNEVKRLLMALQATYKDEVATPAEWQPGGNTIAKKKWKMAKVE